MTNAQRRAQDTYYTLIGEYGPKGRELFYINIDGSSNRRVAMLATALAKLPYIGAVAAEYEKLRSIHHGFFRLMEACNRTGHRGEVAAKVNEASRIGFKPWVFGPAMEVVKVLIS